MIWLLLALAACVYLWQTLRRWDREDRAERERLRYVADVLDNYYDEREEA